MSLKLLPLIAIAVAVPSFAQGSSTQPAGAKASADPLDRMVCRTEETLGSRLNKKRVCLTAREWKQMAEDSREATERVQQGQGTIPSN